MGNKNKGSLRYNPQAQIERDPQDTIPVVSQPVRI